MSIQKLIKEALAKNPLGVKAALEEELRVRVAEAVSAKMNATDLEEEAEQIDEAKAIHEYDWPESALHRGASLGDHAQDAIRHNMHAHDAIGHVYSAADAEGRKWVNKHHDDLLKTFKSHGLQTEEVEQIDEGLDFQNKTSRSGASTIHIYHNGEHLGTIEKHFTKSNPNGSYRIQYNSDTIPVGSKGLHAHEGLPSQEAAKKLVSKHVNESLEQIDELDRKTLHNYLNKALNDLTSINTARKITSNDKSPEDIKHRNDLTRKAVNRKKGFSRAYDRLTKEEVELEEALKIGSKVRIHAPGKDYHGKVGYVGEIRKRTYGTMAPSYTVDYREPGEDYNRSISLSREKIKLHKEEVELDEAAGMVKDGYYVTNQKDGNITHDKPFQDNKYAISHANRGENKTGYVHRVHKVKNGKIDKQWEYNGGHMDGGWEHFSDFKGDDARGHMRNIPKHFLHGND